MYIDFHNDTILNVYFRGDDFKNGSPDLNIDLPKVRLTKDLAGLFFAVCCPPPYVGEEAFGLTVKLLGKIKGLVGESGGALALAVSKDEIARNVEKEKVSVILSVEGGISVNDDLRNIEKFYGDGVRLLTLTHAVPVSWVGNCHDGKERGLNDFGSDVVRLMNNLGMIIDLAHASEKSIFDVTKISSRPVVSSHAVAAGVFKTERALSDDALRAIAETGGVVGVLFFPDMLVPRKDGVDPWVLGKNRLAKILADDSLSPEEKARAVVDMFSLEYSKREELPGVDAVFRHIDYIANLVGEDHVAVGSDFDGMPFSCKGLEDITGLKNLAAFMKSKGYSEGRVEKIMGKNILRAMA